MKLTKSFTKQWIEALRSGKYKQIDEILFDTVSYCVLGVAGLVCKVPAIKMIGVSMIMGNIKYPKELKNIGTSTYISDNFTKLRKDELYNCIKIRVETNRRIVFDQNLLSYLNDNGFSFKALATVIETCILPNLKK